MKRLIALMAFCPLLAFAGPVYKCETGQTTLYSHTPCEAGAQPLDLPRLGILGSARDHAAVEARRKSLRAIPEPEPRKRPPRKGPRRLSYGERMTLRKLEIEADGLARDIPKWSASSSYRQALEEELKLVRERIRELRKRL